jgi:hypothetical protein
MRTIALPWETWRAIIDVLRKQGRPSMLDHADQLEQQLDQHPPDQETVTLHLPNDLFLRSFNWARVQLGIPCNRSGKHVQVRNGSTPNSGAISHTKHQARASSSVLPETSWSSGEWSVTTRLAWSTSHEQQPRRVAIARRRASCRARPPHVGSTPACATVPGAPAGSSRGRTAPASCGHPPSGRHCPHVLLTP